MKLNDPEEDENDDSDSVDTVPENPLLDDILVIDEGEEDGAMTDDDEIQGGMTRLKVLHSMKRV